MNSVPTGWVKTKLVEIATVQTGLSKSATRQGKFVSRPYLRVANVQDGYLDLGEVKYIDVPVEQQERFRLMPGDVLLTEGGDFDKLGRGCVWAGEIKDCVHQNHVFAVRVKESSQLAPRFLALLIQSDRSKAYFVSCAKQTTNLASINSSQLKQLPVLLPPLAEQQEILRMVGEFSTGIDTATELLVALQRRKQGLMQQLLTGRKRLKGFTGKWKLLRADKLFTEISTRNQTAEEPLLSVTQDRGVIPRDMLVGRVTMPAGTVDAFKLVERDNFVISLRSFQGGLEHSAYRGLVSPAYTVLQASDEIHPAYFRHYFKSTDFVKRLSVAVVGIRDGKQISYTDFRSIKLPLPPMAEQTAMTELLDLADQDIALCSARRTALQTQKRALMQKLLSGEWQIPEQPVNHQSLSEKGL